MNTLNMEDRKDRSPVNFGLLMLGIISLGLAFPMGIMGLALYGSSSTPLAVLILLPLSFFSALIGLASLGITLAVFLRGRLG
jgi:hypothetical protein